MRKAAAAGCGALASVFVLAMMLVTVADVAARHLAGRPIQGTVDLVELFLVASVFLALPAVVLREENVVVDILDHVLSAPIIRALKVMGSMALICFLLAMGHNMIVPYLDVLEFDDRTADLQLPRAWYWWPILAGVAGSALAGAFVLVAQVRKAFA